MLSMLGNICNKPECGECWVIVLIIMDAVGMQRMLIVCNKLEWNVENELCNYNCNYNGMVEGMCRVLVIISVTNQNMENVGYL